MVDRFSVWLGAGVVAAGMAAAMISGTAIAFAETGSSDTGGASSSASSASSESSKPAETKADSEKDESTKPANPKPTESKPADESTAKPDGKDLDEPAGDSSSGSNSKPKSNDPPTPTPKSHLTSDFQQSEDRVTEPVEATTKPAADPRPTEAADDHQVVETAEPLKVVADNPKPKSAATAVPSAVAFAAPKMADAAVTAEAAAPPQPSLINVIGTLIFTVFNVATRLFEGPPVLPPGSTVTVRSSTLQLGAYEVPADWYFPTDPDPDRLIYLQHGFLASGRFYSYTAATLAEQTHSIVVAPTVTSNFFAADGFWIGGAPLQSAVADLFVGKRDALTASAIAAGYEGTTLPQRVVIAGHSAGGGLALAVAGYMVENGTIDDLAGLVLLDGVAMGDASALIDNVPDDLPVYQIASPPYAWNMFGATSDALVKARPGQFNGVELVGGSHIDAMQGGNPLLQFAAYLVAGFSQPQNIEAVKILAAGWINDMFAGTHTGIYAEPGDSIAIPTAAGAATAIALPASEASLSPLDQLLRWLFVTGSQSLFNFGSSGTADATVANKETSAA
ncbi:hypothetical protein [Mycobacterium sp. MMS18-G62]